MGPAFTLSLSTRKIGNIQSALPEEDTFAVKYLSVYSVAVIPIFCSFVYVYSQFLVMQLFES